VTISEHGGAGDSSVLGGADRRRALLSALPVVGVVALVDTFGSGTGPRAAIWGALAGSYVVLAFLTDRISPRADLVLGALGGVVAVAAVVALSAVSGGSGSLFFLMLPIVPLMSGLVAPGDLLDQGLQGILAVAGGATLLAREGAPLSRIALWVALVVATVAFALVSGERIRRRQLAFLRMERERSATLERLAEAERARADAERWAAAGQVADQVAHDVNSPLGALRSSLRFAREELQAGHHTGAVEAIDDSAACVERIHAIVAGLSQRIGRPSGAAGRG